MPQAPPEPIPQLCLQSLDRGDGLLGLRPCGPVRPPSRTPLFGARGPIVTVARLRWVTPTTAGRSAGETPPAAPTDDAAAHDRLRRAGLHPLPASALQWRGGASPLPDEPLWSLVREADFADFWAEVLPALRAEGWAIELMPGFAHAALPVAGWQIRIEPLGQPTGMGSWLLSLGIELHTRSGVETLDLVPLLARLIARDRRWTDAAALAAIADDERVRLQLPGGRRIDAPAAPLKAIVGAMVDLLMRPARRGTGALKLSSWDAQRLELLRAGLHGAMAGHPGARRDWLLQGEHGLHWLARQRADLAWPAVPAPDGLGIELRPYQRDGLAWLQHLRRRALAGILADDMGLGKTAQALAHILLERQAGRLDLPALVVAPASLLFNWQAEAARVAPALRLLTLQGPRRHAELARIAGHDLVLTSYPLLWRDAQALQRQRWHLVVLDESQMVKNAGSRTATAARRLDARHRLCLTGTPLENHLGELWSQFHFLLPGFLGDARSFARDWRTPIEKNAETLRARLLAQRVAPFILRRRKDQVATELPPLTEQLHRVELVGAQRTLYESVRLAADERVRAILARQKFDAAMIGILDALLRLRQVCNDPRLLDPATSDVTAAAAAAATAPDRAFAGSAKLDWLSQMLPSLVADGRRVLVFSQFTRMLGLIGVELDALGLPWLTLTGATPPAQRAAQVARFQRGEVPLFLVSLKAGGVGLNLTAADTVVHVDPWWNPAVERQASARAHRIGQTRPVLVYRLVAAGSIEERLLALQARKGALFDAVLGAPGDGDGSAADAAADAAFGPAELQQLLAPL